VSTQRTITFRTGEIQARLDGMIYDVVIETAAGHWNVTGDLQRCLIALAAMADECIALRDEVAALRVVQEAAQALLAADPNPDPDPDAGEFEQALTRLYAALATVEPR
jgi:hypothetical protein